MAKLLAVRDLAGRLVPYDEIGRAAVQKIPIDAIVSVEFRRPRNVQHHRKLFALLNLVFENQTRYPTLEDLLDAIKIGVGHCKEIKLRDGRTGYIPKSIAFHAQDQTGFDQFYAAVIRVVCEQIIPGLSDSDLRRELEELAA